jgi:hypothetical protein
MRGGAPLPGHGAAADPPRSRRDGFTQPRFGRRATSPSIPLAGSGARRRSSRETACGLLRRRCGGLRRPQLGGPSPTMRAPAPMVFLSTCAPGGAGGVWWLW